MCKKSDYITQNLEVIQLRWPNIISYICNTDLPSAQLVTDAVEPTIFIKGIHISSSYDRQSEAILQAHIVDLDSETIWVYGIGTGDLPNCLTHRKKLREINVVLVSTEIFIASINYFDHTRWLSDPRVKLFTPIQKKSLEIPFCIVPASLKLADDTAFKLRDEIVLELNTRFINKTYRENQNNINNISSNIDFMETDHDVSELIGSLSRRQIFVAGAGPSLLDNIELMKNREKNVLLIAVDAALIPLIKAGIDPDIVVSIDSKKDTVSAYFSLNLDPFSKTPLVYFPVVDNEILKKWPGPRYTAYSNSPIYEAVSGVTKSNLLFCSGTVIHATIDLAVKLGAEYINIFGVDLSFPNGVTHASGVAGAAPIDLSIISVVHNGYGEKVPSKPNMIGYLRDLERYIAANNHVIFVNMSKKGAVIEGTVYYGD